MKIKLILMTMLFGIIGAVNSFAACNVKDAAGEWQSGATIGFVVEDEDGNEISSGGSSSDSVGSQRSADSDSGDDGNSDYIFQKGKVYYIYLTVNGSKDVEYQGSGQDYYCQLEIDTSTVGKGFTIVDPDSDEFVILESDLVKGKLNNGDKCVIDLGNIDPEADEEIPFKYEVVDLQYKIGVVKEGVSDGQNVGRHKEITRKNYFKDEKIEVFLTVNGKALDTDGEFYDKKTVVTSSEGGGQLTGHTLQYESLKIELDGKDGNDPDRYTYSVGKINLKKVTFSGLATDFTAVVKDDGNAYHSDQWLDDDLDGTVDHTDPISYVRAKKAKIEAEGGAKIDLTTAIIKIRAKGAVDPDDSSKFQIKIPVKTASTTYDSKKKISTIAMPAVSSTNSFKNNVAYLKDMTIDWEIQLDGGDWVSLGTSQNDAYITLAQPTCAKMYHTLFHIACKNASEKSGKSEVFKGIWDYFETKAVTTHDNISLSYYGKASSRALTTIEYTLPNSTSLARQHSIATTSELLKYKDGKCGAWAAFFQDVLKIHALGATKVQMWADGTKIVKYTPSKREQLGAAWFSVNEIPGQNASVPKERCWPDHVFIEYNKKFYDPSYGLEYESDKNNAVDELKSYGWRVYDDPLIGGAYYYFRKTEDADPSNKKVTFK